MDTLVLENPESETVNQSQENGNQETETGNTANAEIPEGYLSPSEVKALEDAAYLRGRNEAIEARMAEECLPKEPDNDSLPGIDEIFHFRKSVWD